VSSRIGEKILEWSDSRSPIPLDEVLAIVSFYWFTKSFGTSIWPYRASQLGLGGGIQGFPSIGNKPVGFSGFPFELFPIPKSWAEKLFPGMVFYRSHDMVSAKYLTVDNTAVRSGLILSREDILRHSSSPTDISRMLRILLLLSRRM